MRASDKEKDTGPEEGKGRDKPCHDPQLSREAAQDLELFMQLPNAPRGSRQWKQAYKPKFETFRSHKKHLKDLNYQINLVYLHIL